MVRHLTRTFWVIVLIRFIAFNILSMVEGKKHQVRRQYQNNHELHQNCPHPNHHTGTNRKKRSDLLIIDPMLLDRNHTFNIFYDDSKYDEKNIPLLRQILYEKPWDSEDKKENYLENLEKIFGRFPQHTNVRRIEKSSESAKKFNRKFLQKENIQQFLDNFEKYPNHIRVKRNNPKFNQVSAPSMSSEYLQNLAESFAGPSEAEETKNIDTKEIENVERKTQNLGNAKKRSLQVSSMNKIKSRSKRDKDPDELKIHNVKNHRHGKKSINHNKDHSKSKRAREPSKIHNQVLKHKAIEKKANIEKNIKTAGKKINLEKKKSSRISKDLHHEKKNKRSLSMTSSPKNTIDKSRRKRRHSLNERNDLYGSLKSSSSLEEIKNLAENLILKIDHLRETIEKRRMERSSHELSQNVHLKDNTIS